MDWATILILNIENICLKKNFGPIRKRRGFSLENMGGK
jgi:hypothetical protein